MYIEDTLSIIQETFSLFKYGNNFEFLYSEKELCGICYAPETFRDMNFVFHGSTVFCSVMFDFKVLASSLTKLGNTNNL